jgi:hypothetical protein
MPRGVSPRRTQAEPAGSYDAAMDRTEWVSRFMRRLEELDVRLRPAQLAELASARYETHGSAPPEQVADEVGKDGVRRAD